MLKTDELKQEILAKRNEVEKYQQAEELEKAFNAAKELNSLIDKYEIELAKQKATFDKFFSAKDSGGFSRIDTGNYDIATPITDKAKLANRAFNKLLFNRGTLTDAERNAYFNVTGSPGSPAQIEATPSKGGYLVPTEQMAKLQEFRKEFVALKDYVSVVSTNTTSGRWATFSPQDLEFQSFVEMTDIAESDVAFGEATYVIEDRGLILPISNQLVDDADIDIIAFIGRKLEEGAVRTENKEILKPLNKLITGDTESAIAAATTATTHKALNAALFQTLDAGYLNAASIFTNQDGFLWLSNLDDGTNRPLLVPDVTDFHKYRYRGKEIVVLPNSTLPSSASGAKNYAPFFVGDMRSYLTFFERQGVELATSQELYFRKYGTAIRAVIRFGVTVTDPNAMTAVKVEV